MCLGSLPLLTACISARRRAWDFCNDVEGEYDDEDGEDGEDGDDGDDGALLMGISSMEGLGLSQGGGEGR